METAREELLEEYRNIFKDWIPLFRIKFEGTTLHRYADPSDGKFAYPAHRRRSKENIEALRKAETNLDEFWRAIDLHYKSKAAGRSQQDLILPMLSLGCTIQRTPPWVELAKDKKTTDKQDDILQPFSSVYHDRRKQITGNFERVSLLDKPAKRKTRGVAGEQHEQALPGDVSVVEQPKSFKVDKRTHKVSKALFH